MEISECDTRIVNRLKDEVVRLMYDRLCRMLDDPLKFFPYLRSQRLFTQDDEEEILNRVTTSDRCRVFIDKICRRQNAYDIMVDVLLRHRVQSFLAEELETKLQELVRDRGPEFSGNVVHSQGPEDSDDDEAGLPTPVLPYNGPNHVTMH